MPVLGRYERVRRVLYRLWHFPTSTYESHESKLASAICAGLSGSIRIQVGGGRIVVDETTERDSDSWPPLSTATLAIC